MARAHCLEGGATSCSTGTWLSWRAQPTHTRAQLSRYTGATAATVRPLHQLRVHGQDQVDHASGASAALFLVAVAEARKFNAARVGGWVGVE
jgi:hypothetical protein